MNLYFIAIIPPADVRVEIQHLKEKMRDRFGAEHALKLPAHITLISPFKFQEEKELQLLQSLEIFATTRKQFHLWLQNFGNFDSRVLFVKVVDNKILMDLQKDLDEHLTAIHNIPEKKNFHPHLTIATRDLKESIFPEAQRYLTDNDYETRFPVDSLNLFKHNDGEWEILMQFKFGKS